MDYKEKYENAVDALKGLIEVANEDNVTIVKEDLESIFPELLEDKEESCKIPFGAKDSELVEATYFIPEGMEAVIEGDKVIIRRKESEDEKIRQKILFLFYAWRNNEQVNIPNKKEVEKTIAWLERQGEQKPIELAESEDERIRKHLIALVTWSTSYSASGISNVDANKMLAWLEKQGQVKESTISQHENKTCKENDDSLTNKDERVRKELIVFLEELSKLGKNTNFDKWKTSDCANWIAWLEKQKEQAVIDGDKVLIKLSPVKNGEPKFDVGDVIKRKGEHKTYTINEIIGNNYRLDSNVVLPVSMPFLAIGEQDKWELVEQEPVGTEEDKRMLQGIINDGCSQRPLNEYQLGWLKSLKERVKL